MEESKSFEIRLTDLWSVLKRCWWLMLAVLVAVGSVTYIYLKSTHEPRYTSTATLYVLPEKSNNANLSSSDVTIATTLVKDFNELITNDKVLYQVYETSGGMVSPAQLKNMVSVENPTNTRVLYLKVSALNPASAKLLVDAFADATCQVFNDLFSTGENKGQKMLQVVDYGRENKNISNPISMLKVTLIAVISALLVYVVFILIFVLDDKINDGDDVQRYLGVSLLGEIPNRADAHRRKSKYGYYAAQKKPSNPSEQ